MDVDHRLRQHNKEIKGGAVATTKKICMAHTWKRALHVRGFPTWAAALQFEWAFKYYSRKFGKRMYPLERRMRGLHHILHLDRPTSKAVPYYEYNNGLDEEDGIPGPKIVWESDEAKRIFNFLPK